MRSFFFSSKRLSLFPLVCFDVWSQLQDSPTLYHACQLFHQLATHPQNVIIPSTFVLCARCKRPTALYILCVCVNAAHTDTDTQTRTRTQTHTQTDRQTHTHMCVSHAPLPALRSILAMPLLLQICGGCAAVVVHTGAPAGQRRVSPVSAGVEWVSV